MNVFLKKICFVGFVGGYFVFFVYVLFIIYFCIFDMFCIGLWWEILIIVYWINFVIWLKFKDILKRIVIIVMLFFLLIVLVIVLYFVLKWIMCNYNKENIFVWIVLNNFYMEYIK